MPAFDKEKNWRFGENLEESRRVTDLRGIIYQFQVRLCIFVWEIILTEFTMCAAANRRTL